MRVVILCAGYGTRLQKDIQQEPTRSYEHLLDVPKPLVPVGGKCLISRWMADLMVLKKKGKVDDIFVVCNHYYFAEFENWAKSWPDVTILDDGTSTNETRLGAVADLDFCLSKHGMKDDLLIIGGHPIKTDVRYLVDQADQAIHLLVLSPYRVRDTLFYHDFNLEHILDGFYSRKTNEIGGALVTCYKCQDEETSKFGILELADNGEVVSFLEKPDPQLTLSRWACPCFYVLSKEACQLIPIFLEEKRHAPLKEKDATGHFIKYLQGRRSVFAIALKSGRFDIGSLQSYIECDKYFSGI